MPEKKQKPVINLLTQGEFTMNNELLIKLQVARSKANKVKKVAAQARIDNYFFGKGEFEAPKPKKNRDDVPMHILVGGK
jgi:hypothetical protein